MTTNEQGREARNRAAQIELYGAPLSELFARLKETFHFTQGQLASTIGLSAPMLSQLASGQRVKIGNPAVMVRLSGLSTLADEVEAGQVADDALDARLADVRATTGSLTGTTYGQSAHPPQLAPEDVVHLMQGLLRAVASLQELHMVSTSIKGEHPDLAELIRVYGVGRTEEAVSHFKRHEHLLNV